MADWHIFRGKGPDHDGIASLPAAPPWRDFAREQASAYQISEPEIEMVNAALYLRRPLLVTGPPGVGKSTLAEVVARELRLGPVLRWSIGSRSTLAEGLYQYDALARLRDTQRQRDPNASAPPEDIGRYIRLGPLGAALYPRPVPRVLLIDEIDKSDIDLPNDLLHAFERGEYAIAELVRLADEAGEVKVFPATEDGDERVTVRRGRVRCDAFPLVIMTSNGERQLPPPFLRRCLRLDIEPPDANRLKDIVSSHLTGRDADAVGEVIKDFVDRRGKGLLATDQLLNAVFLLTLPQGPTGKKADEMRQALLRELGQS